MIIANLTGRRRVSPDRDGWWLFREQSLSFDQRILVIGGHVASDDEWQQEMGYSPEGDGAENENYFEVCSVAEMTDGTLTRGLWRFDCPLNL